MLAVVGTTLSLGGLVFLVFLGRPLTVAGQKTDSLVTKIAFLLVCMSITFVGGLLWRQ